MTEKIYVHYTDDNGGYVISRSPEAPEGLPRPGEVKQ